MIWTNALAYFAAVSLTKKKGFKTLEPDSGKWTTSKTKKNSEKSATPSQSKFQGKLIEGKDSVR